ncbi:MAG: hypothetical protein IKW26_07650 [Treponema sp.]|nr:hypothetical protein [Treponema sp.]
MVTDINTNRLMRLVTSLRSFLYSYYKESIADHVSGKILNLINTLCSEISEMSNKFDLTDDLKILVNQLKSEINSPHTCDSRIISQLLNMIDEVDKEIDRISNEYQSYKIESNIDSPVSKQQNQNTQKDNPSLEQQVQNIHKGASVLEQKIDAMQKKVCSLLDQQMDDSQKETPLLEREMTDYQRDNFLLELEQKIKAMQKENALLQQKIQIAELDRAKLQQQVKELLDREESRKSNEQSVRTGPWMYRRESYNDTEKINKLAEEGWEFVGCNDYSVFLKKTFTLCKSCDGKGYVKDKVVWGGEFTTKKCWMCSGTGKI